MPEFGGAGRKVMFTRLPLCKPVPEKLAGRLSVCCCSTTGLDKTGRGLASAGWFWPDVRTLNP